MKDTIALKNIDFFNVHDSISGKEMLLQCKIISRFCATGDETISFVESILT